MDDHAVFADAVRVLLAADSRLEVVGVATDAERALELAAGGRADVVLVDLDMPGVSGTQLTQTLRAEQPGTQVILVTGHERDVAEAAAAESGAVGFMVKGCLDREIGDEICRVARRDS